MDQSIINLIVYCYLIEVFVRICGLDWRQRMLTRHEKRIVELEKQLLRANRNLWELNYKVKRKEDGRSSSL